MSAKVKQASYVLAKKLRPAFLIELKIDKLKC